MPIPVNLYSVRIIESGESVSTRWLWASTDRDTRSLLLQSVSKDKRVRKGPIIGQNRLLVATELMVFERGLEGFRISPKMRKPWFYKTT